MRYWLRAQAAHDTEVAEREFAPLLKRIMPWVAHGTGAMGAAATSSRR